MKRIYIFIILLCALLNTRAQHTNNNYVKTVTPTVAVTNTSNLTVDNSITSYQYFDGLGRPWQTVQVGGSYQKADVVSYQEYDAFGRESNSWLPVTTATTNNGLPLSLATVKSRSTSLYADNKAYAKPVYEVSPLNRVLEQYDPGQNWHDNAKSIKTAYLTNNNAYPCRWYCTVSNRSDVGISITSGKTNYADGELYVTKITDEEGNISYEFKDKQGQIILIRQMDGNTTHDTYYVYDDYGNLRAVLPPLAADALTTAGTTWTDATAALANYAYLYKYDYRNRMTAKKLPGAGWVIYQYDKADRLIFSQDGEQAAKTPKEWTFYLPDALGRTVLQGTCTNTNTASIANIVVTTSFTAANTGIGSSGYSSSFAITSPTVHTVNYYDDYSFRGLTGFELNNYSPGTNSPKGLLTGSVTTVLGSTTKLYKANYYDSRGRVHYMISSNHMGGFDRVINYYTFTGKPKTVLLFHTASGKASQNQEYTYTYDHAERLVSVNHKLNNNPSAYIIQYAYDEKGNCSSNFPLDVTDLATVYTYNVRSWITGISSTHFTEDLTYKYNGNIASMQWLTGGKTRKYTYTYDPLSRLKTAAYTGATTAEKYNTSYTYDKHGNIKTLERYGKTTASAYGMVDKLTMGYVGNQLTNVTDAGVTVTLPESNDFKKGSAANPGYAYNKNGAMTKDLNKKISNISYNSLHLPKSLVINGVTHRYTYAADGTKLRVTQGSTNRDYAGSIIYENGSLKRILVEGGYIEGGTYHFFLNDHLGNTRVVANAGGTAVQRDHYYPFGLPMAETTNTEQNKQPYKYNGKEFDRTNGLNLYDYHARQYDAGIGRFTTMDPLAEKKPWLTPYHYCSNNPVNRVDPDGKDDYFNSRGRFVMRTKSGNQIRIMMPTGNVRPTDLNYSSGNKYNRMVLTNITTHYVNQVTGGGKKVGIVDVNSKKVGNAFAAYNTRSGQYSIAVKEDGTINPYADNVNHMENSFVHESKHESDPSSRSALGEVSAIVYQSNHSSFAGTDTEFKNSIGAYAASSLNEAIKDKATPLQIQNAIGLLNNSPIGENVFFEYDPRKNNVTYSIMMPDLIISGNSQ